MKTGDSVFFIKNGYGATGVMSLEAYSALTDEVEKALDVADRMAVEDKARLTHDEVFEKLSDKGKE